MKVVIKYTAIDPYYSDQVQVFCGCDAQSIEDQISEFEDFLGKEHPMGFSAIYLKQVLQDASGMFINELIPIK